MTSDIDWRELDLEHRSSWRRIFNEDWKNDSPEAACPICSHHTLHRWYKQESVQAKVLRGQSFIGHGRLWEWCSTCHAYEYYPDGFVPAWWKEPYPVDPALLKYDPGPIDAARAKAAERRSTNAGDIPN
jgi:hypothetical protein